MFLPPARVDLQERLGYERYVLDKCVGMVQVAYGIVSATVVVVKDQPPHDVVMGIEEVAGAGLAMGIVRDASPLLFSAAFKTLDMVIEWTIFENKGSCPWKFHQKQQIVNTSTSLTYPDYLQTNHHLRGVLLALYNRLSSFRNAISHGNWGANDDGELAFDFINQYNNAHIQQTVPFQVVLDFAAFAALIADTLVDPTLQTPPRFAALLWLTNRIQPLHQLAQVNAPQPHHYKVRRLTNWEAAPPVEIDLAAIRQLLNQMQSGENTFDLAVEATTPNATESWAISAEVLPAGNTLLLDHAWDQYKAAVPQAAAPQPAVAPPHTGREPRWVTPFSWTPILLGIGILAVGVLLGWGLATLLR
jgi:hypothetical protein